MKLLITCPKGINKILNQELKFLGFTHYNNFPTGSYVDSDQGGIIRLNLRSRTANKVFIQAHRQANITSFDALFDAIYSIQREQYLYKKSELSIKVFTHNSQLNSISAIQSISHKAILQKLDQQGIQANNDIQTIFEIQVHFNNNECSVFLNTSGAALHERGYRKFASEAPLKENIAAALVLMSGRTFKSNLWDPCCGSGTIPIEAAMIAKNIAPGLHRNFAFQHFANYDHSLFSDYLESANKAIYPSNDYRIIGTDKDQAMIHNAKKNAELAGVGDCINFRWDDLLSQTSGIDSNRKNYIVSNPPYGKRLAPLEIHEVYQKFVELGNNKNNEVCIISSYADFEKVTGKYRRKQKEVNNGGELCFIRSN